jgi:hypothetical protein
MMFTLSSYAILYISIVLPRCGESNLPTIDRHTLRPLNTHLLLKNLLGKVMSPAYWRKTTR